MKRTILFLSLALTTLFASAQTDSLSMEQKTYNLNEVVVKSDVALTSAEKSTYLPTRKQRNAATDATSLLQHMMIPQLSIVPMTESVKTIANEEVAIFIDYLPATKEDLQGMNTQDVKRVEIYDFPKDVRFQNKPHVVNFVMQKYTLGGYTKLTTTNMILADFTSNNSVYSKLAHKNWTFDANLSGRFSNKNHMGMEKTETFRLTANPTTRAELFVNPTQTITRTETAHDGKQRTERNSASLRATYATEKMQLANRLEFLDDNTPKQELAGEVSYSSKSVYSFSKKTARNLTPTYTGNWNFFLPKDWSLSVSPQLQYSRNEQNRLYKEGENTQIVNDINENTTSLNWTLDLGKTFADKHTISLTNYGLDYASDLDYKGSTLAQSKLDIFVIGQGLEYSFSTEKLNLSAEFDLAFQRNKVDGEAERLWYPIASIEGTYSPNKRHSIGLFFNYNSSGARGSERNPSVMQTNELMYYSGNPALKNYQTLNAWLQYVWMPSNTFTASAFAQHYFYHDYLANTFETYNDGAALIRRIENVGDANITKIGANLTLRLLDRNLQINAAPLVEILNVTGRYDERETLFKLDMKASYYLGQFYFMAGYTTPHKTYSHTSVAWQRDRSTYYLTAGWGNAHWKARLDIVNPFRSDWRSTRTTISTPFYTQISDTFNSSSHQRINLTLTYIFNYGKKVKQGNELGTATGGQSSIL